MATPTYWATACTDLAARDTVLAQLIADFPGSVVQSRGAALETLQRAIVGQQISVQAAAAVWQRCVAVLGNPNDPAAWVRLPEPALRTCGLSGQKVGYVRGIAQAFVQGQLHPHRWPHLPDTAVLAELVALPGVGVWTAEMFLIFHLLRPDVLPVGDLGLIKAFRQHYGAQWKTATTLAGWQGRLRRYAAKHWAPYRSVATWYLWRSLDPHEVGY